MEMEMAAAPVRRDLSRQFSAESIYKSGRVSVRQQASLDPKGSGANITARFTFGRQSSLDPNQRTPIREELTVPENLDSTMQLLFLACKGDADGVEDLLEEGINVHSIDLDGRTALHIAACELLLSWKANIDARDRWGSTAAADAKHYGKVEVYSLLRAREAKVPKPRKMPMAVSNPREVPEYELNPGELQFRRGEEIAKFSYGEVEPKSDCDRKEVFGTKDSYLLFEGTKSDFPGNTQGWV